MAEGNMLRAEMADLETKVLTADLKKQIEDKILEEVEGKWSNKWKESVEENDLLNEMMSNLHQVIS